MDWQALGRRQELVIGRYDTAREITGGVEDAGTAGSQERVGHLADDPLQPVVEQGQADTIGCRFHGHASSSRDGVPGMIDKLPDGRRSATAPGPRTMLVNADSTIAGPQRRSPHEIESKRRMLAVSHPSPAK